jgi:hypothetical protein
MIGIEMILPPWCVLLAFDTLSTIILDYIIQMWNKLILESGLYIRVCVEERC